jgi:hypothetical protein
VIDLPARSRLSFLETGLEKENLHGIE